ncbi:MAG TPA: TIGR02680 family protein [Oscillospiraceae bacterium]|nr:TIGR02680 family protein [Oscillospiraceae bacterium]
MSKDKKWTINRAGLLNFWYYDEEEFYFSDGKLLLRGDNGSGKSVTMQSLIPILLDGRKSPDRLDPFGSRSRKMEDYLLGEKELVDRDERTGYLYLEYKRQGLNQYITTGIGLRAKRYSSMDFWGFIIQDNRRVGHDLALYNTEYSGEDGKKVKVPLSRLELENRLGQGGRVVRGQKEYMELVNKHIFGFESVEAYEELIKLLIQLRSPKLSKDFKPTVIYEILNESLPALSDEDLRPLSETIENMDQTKQQMEQLQRDRQSLKRLCRHYDRYNRFVLAEKSAGFVKAARDVGKHKQQQYSLHLTDLRREQDALAEEYRALKKHDVFNMEEEKNHLEKRIAGLKEQEAQKSALLRQKQEKERFLQDEINLEEEKNYSLQKELKDLLSEMSLAAEECKFDGHTLAAAEFEEQYVQAEEFHFGLWRRDAAEYLHKLEHVLAVLQEEARVKEKHRETDFELSEARRELDQRRLEEKKWYSLFEEEKEKLLTAIHQWLTASEEVRLTAEEVQQLISACNHLYEDYSYEAARSPLFQARQRCASKLESALVALTHQSKEKQKEKLELEQKIKEWKEMKEPEPARHPDTVEARCELEKAGIPYLPFFAAVEFRPEVPADVRERLESAITQMGLLDALIVPEKYAQAAINSNRIIKPDPHILAHTLAEYLYPTPPQEPQGLTAGDIDNVLRSILIGENQQDVSVPIVNAEGRYRLSLLAGHAPREKQAVFIGKEARVNHRKQVIARLTENLAEVMTELQALHEKQEQLENRRQKLVEEYESFPRDTDVAEAYTNFKELKIQVNAQRKEVERVNEKLRIIIDKLQRIREIVRSKAAGMPLDTNVEIYLSAVGCMKEYMTCLQKLEITYQKFFSGLRRLAQIGTNLQDVEEDVDGLKGELNVLSDQLIIENRQLNEVFKKLEELGAQEIRQEIESIEKRLRTIPDERVELTKKERDVGNAVVRLTEEIGQKELEYQAAAALAAQWEKVFLAEYHLQLTPEEEFLTLQDNDALKLAIKIKQKIGHLLAESEREKVTESLNQSFYQEQGVLVEYRPNLDAILELEIPSEHFLVTSADDHIGIKVEQLARVSRRIQLMLEYGGKRVSPYFVQKEMDKDIELQQIILSEKDRQLYEDIIVHSVGRLIRSRIYRAEKWVKQIDKLMADRDTSSGLTFSLKWKPRTAESEDELDTQDLVEILRRDSHLLSENDLDKVTRHFRSQIERAKESMVEKGYGETLHQVIKEMLDYRRWFSFTLYYRKEGEAKKELTNHVFFTFSGGEKAMAMYIPLFSAAYSRYLEARDDAPFIISLDEAFAGVDERNIRDMFDLVEKLNFNYIMNSQALWGDYDTVPALSIHELIRPQNAPYVSVIRYYWNGQVRRMLRPQEVLPSERERAAEEQYAG